MSYFNTLNQFVDNAQEAQAHIDDYKNSIVASKVGDIKEKYDQYIDRIESFGQATTGVATTYHLGRKIYKKTKEKYGKDPARQSKKQEEDETKKATEDEPKGGEAEGSDIIKNPAFDPDDATRVSAVQETSIDDAVAAARPEVPKTQPEPAAPEEAGNVKTVTGDEDMDAFQRQLDKQNADFADQVRAESQARRAKSGLDAPDPNAPTKAEPPTTTDEAPITNIDNTVANTKSALVDGVDEAGNALKDGVISQGKAMVNKFVDNAGAKIAEKVGFDVVGAAADAIPVIGEIAGLAQIFHGLHKELKERKQEGKEESATALSVRVGGGVASGGVDLGAVAKQVAPLAGLV